mmetsp:Transcript_10329/g.22791  ORF Transcript_10329/g.22791 Transcript_10329/m.22791 type:complete len:166 (-) Transcript_10329:70-567(-)
MVGFKCLTWILILLCTMVLFVSSSASTSRKQLRGKAKPHASQATPSSGLHPSAISKARRAKAAAAAAAASPELWKNAIPTSILSGHEQRRLSTSGTNVLINGWGDNTTKTGTFTCVDEVTICSNLQYCCRCKSHLSMHDAWEAKNGEAFVTKGTYVGDTTCSCCN